MNNKQQSQRLSRISSTSNGLENRNETQNVLTRSIISGYDSITNIFAGFFQTSRSQKNAEQELIIKNNQLRQQKNRKIWEEHSSKSITVLMKQSTKVIQKPNKISIKEKLLISLMANKQKVTQKLFNILKQRVEKLQQAAIQPIFMETTMNMGKDDLKQLFTNTFIKQKQQTISKLNLILKCFSIHRLDIGQRKAIAVIASILFGILNKNCFITFVQLCHLTLSSCFLSFILQQKIVIQRIKNQVNILISDKCPGLFVLLNTKYQISITQYLNQWIGSLFLCLQLQGMSSKLNRYYQNNEDQFILKVLNYLFVNKFSKQSLIHTTVCLFQSLQKEIFRQQKKEMVLNILKKPRMFMDQTLFFKQLLR